MLNKIYKTCFIATIAVLPMITYGALDKTSAFFTSAKDIVTNILIPLAFTLALLFFFWGVAKYIKSAGSEKDSKDSKNLLIWGIVGLFVMVTIWGIVSFLKSDLGFGSDVGVPQIHF